MDGAFPHAVCLESAAHLDGTESKAAVVTLGSMPTSSKPCPGGLSQETQKFLRESGDRRRLGKYPCELCGRTVDVEETGERWILERHFPPLANLRHNATMRNVGA